MKIQLFSRQLWLWQRIPAKVISNKSIDKELTFLLIYSIGYVFLGYLIGLLIQIQPIPILGAKNFVQDFWYSVIFKLLCLLIIPTYVYFFKWNYSINDLILDFKPRPKNLILGSLLVLFGFFLNAGHLSGIKSQIPLFDDAVLRLAMGVIFPLIIAGLPEELFFRGYLQTRLEKKWNRISAILLSSLLFTAWHLPSRYLLSNGIEGQAGDFFGVLTGTGLPVFIVSIFFGLHWSRYRNIILLIMVHWAIDILPSLSSFFNVSY